MARKEHKPPKNAAPPRLARVFNIIGIATVFVGAVGVFISMVNRSQAFPPWLRTAAVVVMAVGGIIWFLSGMPREQALEWIKSGLFAIAIALLIRWPIAEPYRIPSGSMEPTLMGDPRILRGDRVFVNKWIYGVRYPFMNKRIWQGAPVERWDVVVFKAVEENAQHGTLVKRVVGLPGEHIQIKNGKVYADGEALELPESMPDVRYTSNNPRMKYGVLPGEKFSVVPEGHYLVLGDNSGSSRDGRFFGWLPNENIVGRVACIWWPPHHWRDFTGFSGTWWWRIVVTLTGLLVLARLFIGRSWVVARPGSARKLDHLYIQFASYGLRLPLTKLWLVRWRAPRRGDLVLYHTRSDKVPQGTVLVGRVAGLPEEQVAIEDGTLQVNGDPLTGQAPLDSGNYASSHGDALYGRSKGKQYRNVPPRHYFILVDPEEPEDDDGPWDSRMVGWVPQEDIVGQAKAIWWPPKRWRRV